MSRAGEFVPGRLSGPWDMQKVFGENYIRLGRQIANLNTEFEMLEMLDASENDREEHKENCRKCMKHMIVTCEELGLVSSQALVSHAYDEADLHFLSEAAAQFRFFKSGWRVRVAHGRATYNEPEAIEAITSARFSRLWLLV